MIIQDPAHEVILGGLALMIDGKPVEYPEGYTLGVLGEDVTFGNPQPVITTLFSMLSAGSLVTRDGDDNRSPSFRVQISSPIEDGNALAAGEKALMAVCNRPVELEWLPPQFGAARAVFDVVDSSIEHVFDDVEERRISRTYRVSMSALPYARPTDMVVSPALDTGAATVTSIDTGGSATGWTSPNGTPSVSSGGVIASATHGEAALTRTGSVAFTTTPYLIVEWHAPAGFQRAYPPKLSVSAGGGAWQSAVAETAVVVGGIQAVRSYFKMTGTATTLAFRADSIYQVFGPYFLRIFDLSRTAASPSSSTRHQLFRSIEVGGSAPTYGDIDVVHDSTILGNTGVYTYPAELGYQPAMSSFLAEPPALSRTLDSSTLSGQYHTLTTSYWLIPAAAIPEGEYEMVVRVRNQGATQDVAFEWISRSWMNGASVLPGHQEVGSVITNMPSGVWVNVTLGVVNLPYARVGVGGECQVVLGTVTPNVLLDEMWIFNTVGSLTMVDVPTRRLRITAPSLEEPRGAILVANNEDFSDAYSASPLCSARAHHGMKPGPNNVFTFTHLATDAKVSAKHYDRSHTHPSA